MMRRELEEAAAPSAAAYGVPLAALMAVVDVESGGRAFWVVNGLPEPLILFEPHVFWRALPAARRADAAAQGLAYPTWGEKPYPPGQNAQWARLWAAELIDREAAHAATSWGVGQVLGENGEWLGYGGAQGLSQRARGGLEGQIDVMVRFIRRRGLIDALLAQDWTAFARGYNGPLHHRHDYAGRLRRSFESYGGVPAPSDPTVLRLGADGAAVYALQRRLRALGHTIAVDGDFGPATRRAVMAFQREEGLRADGIAGPRTLAALEALTRESAA